MSDNSPIVLSPLGHTWFIDIDGTIVKHNGYIIDGYDTLLDGVNSFFNQIPINDVIVLVTSRKESERQRTLDFLRDKGIRYDYIIFNLPLGERILINDSKLSGLRCSVSVNLQRDKFNIGKLEIDSSL